MSDLFHVLSEVSKALLQDRVLQVNEVSVGRGLVIDWRTVRSGDTLGEGLCAYDAAALWVSLVGVEAALSAL